jgi:hypothetical protein
MTYFAVGDPDEVQAQLDELRREEVKPKQLIYEEQQADVARGAVKHEPMT